MTTQQFLFDTLKRIFNKNLDKKLSWYYICNEIYTNRKLSHLSMVGDTDILEMLRLFRIGLYISEEPMGNFRCKSEIPNFVDYEFLVNVSCKEYIYGHMLNDDSLQIQPEIIQTYKEKISSLEKELAKYTSKDEVNKEESKEEEIKKNSKEEVQPNIEPKKTKTNTRKKFVNKEFNKSIKKFILETFVKYSDTELNIPFLIDEYISIFGALPDKFTRTEFYAYLNNTIRLFVDKNVLQKSKNQYYTNENTEKELLTLLPK